MSNYLVVLDMPEGPYLVIEPEVGFGPPTPCVMEYPRQAMDVIRGFYQDICENDLAAKPKILKFLFSTKPHVVKFDYPLSMINLLIKDRDTFILPKEGDGEQINIIYKCVKVDKVLLKKSIIDMSRDEVTTSLSGTKQGWHY